MTAKILTDKQLAEMLNAATWHDLSWSEAAPVLCAALRQYHESEAALEALKVAIRGAEIALAYGPSGRLTRQYPSSFGANNPA